MVTMNNNGREEKRREEKKPSLADKIERELRFVEFVNLTKMIVTAMGEKKTCIADEDTKQIIDVYTYPIEEERRKCTQQMSELSKAEQEIILTKAKSMAIATFLLNFKRAHSTEHEALFMRPLKNFIQHNDPLKSFESEQEVKVSGILHKMAAQEIILDAKLARLQPNAMEHHSLKDPETLELCHANLHCAVKFHNLDKNTRKRLSQNRRAVLQERIKFNQTRTAFKKYLNERGLTLSEPTITTLLKVAILHDQQSKIQDQMLAIMKNNEASNNDPLTQVVAEHVQKTLGNPLNNEKRIIAAISLEDMLRIQSLATKRQIIRQKMDHTKECLNGNIQINHEDNKFNSAIDAIAKFMHDYTRE